MGNDEQLKLRAFAVIDTNVVVSPLLSDGGAPAEVMGYVDNGNIIPLYDDRTLNEYEQVLSYAKLNIDANKREGTLQSIKDNGILVTDVREAEREIVDRNNVPFFEVKAATEDDLDSYLATGNTKHFPDEDSHIVTPWEMVLLMRKLNGFVERNWWHPRDMTAAIRALLDGDPKYSLGKKCAESFGLPAIQEDAEAIDEQCGKAVEPHGKASKAAEKSTGREGDNQGGCLER